jgi:hypothetical protein
LSGGQLSGVLDTYDRVLDSKGNGVNIPQPGAGWKTKVEMESGRQKKRGKVFNLFHVFFFPTSHLFFYSFPRSGFFFLFDPLKNKNNQKTKKKQQTNLKKKWNKKMEKKNKKKEKQRKKVGKKWERNKIRTERKQAKESKKKKQNQNKKREREAP